jgi:hypothetical protein
MKAHPRENPKVEDHACADACEGLSHDSWCHRKAPDITKLGRSLKKSKKNHDDGKGTRPTTASDGKSTKEKRCEQFFLSEYPTVVLQRVTKEIAQRNNRNSGLFFFYRAKQISCEELTDRAN